MTHRGTHVYFPSGTAGHLRENRGHRLGDAPPRPVWMEDRTDLPCQQPHPDAAWFSPDKDEPAGCEDEATQTARNAARDRAIVLCRTCPMELDCRDHGLTYHHYGIWGGVRLEGLLWADKQRMLAELGRERRRRSA
jgi:hypothetical protein